MDSKIEYSSPPLVEVAISVQFEPPKGLTQAHLGAFWYLHRDEYPDVRAVQPIASTNEEFGSGQWFPPILQLELTNQPNTRIQMTSRDDQWMCQIQRDRIVLNWRKRGDEYPRYHASLKRFKDAFNAWVAFLSDMELHLDGVHNWEVTYVNRIHQKELWNSPEDWPKVLPGLLSGNQLVSGLALNGIQGQWVWESSDPVSRLFVEPKPGRSSEDGKMDILHLSLTARGPLESTGTFDMKTNFSAILERIDFGHNNIVKTFNQITSSEAKSKWGVQC